jgi:hypothetical protein
MTLKYAFAVALLSLFLAIPLTVIAASAEGQFKWFVLRNHEVGNCWTAVLIRIDGQYINTFEQKAGGLTTQRRKLSRGNTPWRAWARANKVEIVQGPPDTRIDHPHHPTHRNRHLIHRPISPPEPRNLARDP